MKKLLSLLTLIFILSSCRGRAEKEGLIVKDKYNNYYRLTSIDAVGTERYRLIKLDTTEIKTF